MGYNLTETAAGEVAGSLRMIGDLSTRTGLTMTEWNLKSERAVNNVALAYARYANVVKTSNTPIVDAAHEQALVYQRVEAAHLAVTAAIAKEEKAYADLALIASRSYVEADRADMNTAANNRLAIALGERSIATKKAAEADALLIIADRNVAIETELATVKQQQAALGVREAIQKQGAITNAMAAENIASLRSASQAAIGVGAAMEVVAAAIAVAMMYASSKAGSFTSEIILLHTQARVATEQLPKLSTAILGMAGDVGFSANKLASALFFIESIGGGSYTAAHALDILNAAAKGAAVGHSDLDATAKALAATMAAFPGMLPTQAMGQLDAIVGQGMMTMENLNQALSTGILATLKSSGVSLADFGGALATMTDYAIPATQAANSLRMAIYLIDAPTGASNKVLSQFGLTMDEASTASAAWTEALKKAGLKHSQLADDLRKPGGLIIAMQDLKSHFEIAGMSADAQADAIYRAFGGGKMGKAIITLFENVQGGAKASSDALKAMGFDEAELATLTDRLVEKTRRINEQTNLLGTNFKYIQDNDPAQMWNQFKASVDAVVISLGIAFLPVMIDVMRAFLPILKGFTEWTLANKDLIKVLSLGALAFFGIVGAAFIFIGMLGLVGAAIAGIAVLGPALAPVAIIFGVLAYAAGVLGAAGLLILVHWKQVEKYWNENFAPATTRVLNSIKFIWGAIVQGIQTVKPMFDAAFASFGTTLTAHGGFLDDVSKAWDNFSKQLVWFIKSPEFAAMIADFAVTIPAALKVALDAAIVFADVLQLAFTYAATAAKITAKSLAGDWNGAVQEANKGSAEIVRIGGRMMKDIIQTQKDQDALFSDENSNMWNQVYQSILDMQAKIGRDGSVAIMGAGKQMDDALTLSGQKLQKTVYDSGMTVGQMEAAGILAGLDSRQEAINSRLEQIAFSMRGVMRRSLMAESPSKLFANDVGAPIMQGILMGIENEYPTMEHRFTGMMTAMANPEPVNFKPSFQLPLASPPPINISQNSDSKTLESILEELKRWNEKRSGGPATGIEQLIYKLTSEADVARARGQKSYVP